MGNGSIWQGTFSFSQPDRAASTAGEGPLPGLRAADGARDQPGHTKVARLLPQAAGSGCIPVCAGCLRLYNLEGTASLPPAEAKACCSQLGQVSVTCFHEPSRARQVLAAPPDEDSACRPLSEVLLSCRLACRAKLCLLGLQVQALPLTGTAVCGCLRCSQSASCPAGLHWAQRPDRRSTLPEHTDNQTRSVYHLHVRRRHGLCLSCY